MSMVKVKLITFKIEKGTFASIKLSPVLTRYTDSILKRKQFYLFGLFERIFWENALCLGVRGALMK